jgi:hypothetical protein
MATTFDFSANKIQLLKPADLSVGSTKLPNLTMVPGSYKTTNFPLTNITPPFIPSNSGANTLKGLSGLGLPNSATDQSKSGFKVRLISILAMSKNSPSDIPQVIFEVTPTISESGSVEYTSVQPIHMPGGISVYKFTSSRSFEISAHFVSRNTADALQNMQYLQILRSWRNPFFGNSTTQFKASNSAPPSTTDSQMKNATNRIQNGNASNNRGVNLLGAPPEILYLYGYSSSTNDSRQSAPGVNLNRIPVVLTNLSIQYPEDVDYIPVQISPTANTEPWPVKMDVTISLLETHSPTEYEQFSLEAFKAGKLKHF